MDYQGLNKRVSDLLSEDLQGKDYARIRDELLKEGFQPQEVKYMMQIIDDKGIIPTAAKGDETAPNRNIILGSIMCLISMIVVASLYIGQKATKEVYYVALVIFALGYYILRSGLKQRSESKASSDS